MPEVDGRPVPPRVIRAVAEAETAGFANSSRASVGRLLATVAASKPSGRIGESGTGFGVGTAWLHSGMTSDAALVTVDRDPQRAASAEALFGDDPRVRVLNGEWRMLADYAPFDVLFCDGGGKKEGPDVLVELLAPRGVLVLDDFAPADTWPPRYAGDVDELRLAYLTSPSLQAVEVQLERDMAVILAVRR